MGNKKYLYFQKDLGGEIGPTTPLGCTPPPLSQAIRPIFAGKTISFPEPQPLFPAIQGVYHKEKHKYLGPEGFLGNVRPPGRWIRSVGRG